jgi:photosystem II stability/assembly factor-like uncharacterized protein
MKKTHCKKITIIALGLLIPHFLFSQHLADNWLFGDFGLKFQDDSIIIQHDYAIHENRGEGIISDKNGNLLFYSDGFNVWNRNHELMPNGRNLLLAKGSPAIHESLIVPKPGSDSIYYLFTVDPWNGQVASGLYYSIIDISKENGLGDVILRSKKILNNVSNKITAVYHTNQHDVWLITQKHESNNYYSYLLSESGLSDLPVISSVGKSINSDFDGQMKASPDGKKIAISYFLWVGGEGYTLFDFIGSTGELVNPMNFELPVYYRGCDGLEFSSDATKLFVIQTGSTGESGLYQFDITGQSFNDINDSRKLLYREDYNSFTQMQLAPNGKIYITKGGGGGGTEHLGVIENPNDYGDKCIVKENGLYLDGGDTFVAMTPNFVQSYFFKTYFTFDINCQSAPVKFHVTNDFRLDSVRWFFGEGSSSNSLNPQLQYSRAGKYEIQLIAYYPEKTDTIIRQITIDPFSEFDLGVDRTVCRESELFIKERFGSYLWNTGSQTWNTKIERNGLYKLTVKNSFGCYSSDSVLINTIDLPVIDLPDSIVIRDFDSIQINPGSFSSYLWSTGEATPSIYVKEEGWYSVEVKNDFGCSAAKSVFVLGKPHEDEENSDWELLNPLPTLLTGKDVFFLNDQIGFFITASELFRTIDGGISWKKMMKTSSGNKIAFKNNIGYIIGDYGSIYKSTYLGSGWNKLDVNFSDNFNAITLIDQDTLLITSNNKLFVSNDGGQSWETHNVIGADIEDSYFTSSKTGHIVCKNGKILKTIDGGLNWYITETVNQIPSDFFTIYFVNDSIGFATRQHDDIFKTTDGGESWHEISGNYDALYDFNFVNPLVGFAVGEYGVIYKTTNGGDTWNLACFQNGKIDGTSLYGVNFINEDIGFAVGMDGLILKTINGGTSWMKYAPTYNDVSQLDFITRETGYALIGGDFFKTTDSGKSWLNIGRPLTNQKTGPFDFIDENIGYVITGGTVGTSASSNKVYKTIDGGISWLPTGDKFGYFNDDFYSIDFIDEKLGFVSGGYNDRSVFRTKNGGNTWEKVESICFGQIQFPDSLNGYAVRIFNGYYRIYKTTNGGDTWTVSFEIEEDIRAFHFIDKNNGYFVGDNSLMYKTNDGGISWQKLVIPYEYYVNVHFYSNNVGYILDEEGSLYKTENGGAKWDKQLYLYGINSIKFFENNIFISGTNGKILKNKIDFDSISIYNNPVEEYSNASAKFTGSVASNGEEIKNIRFEYGINYSFDHVVSTSPDSVINNSSANVTVEVNDLKPESTYYYRLKATCQGKDYTSNINNFTTLSDYEIQLSYPYSQYSDQVYLNGSITTRGVEITDIEFQYATDTVFTGISTIPSKVSGDTTIALECHISQLQPETKYSVRIKAKKKDKTIYSSVYQFTTYPEYTISFFNPYIVDKNVTLRGTIASYKDSIQDIVFEYGTTRNYQKYVQSDRPSVGIIDYVSIQAQLTDLDPDSIYFYRVRATMGSKTIYSSENILDLKKGITLVPMEVEQLSDNSLQLKVMILTNGKFIYNIQFRYGTSDVLNDSVLGLPSYTMGYQTSIVSATLTGLIPDTEYHFQTTAVSGKEFVYSPKYSFMLRNLNGFGTIKIPAEIEVYPNPANDHITINSSAIINRIELLNSSGKMLFTKQNDGIVDISGFPPGVYFVKVFMNEGFLSKKIIKK